MNGCGFGDLTKNQEKSGKSFELYYQNVRGLRTKLDEFSLGISCSNADLFAITETGCNKSIHDAEMIPQGYTILRCDRADGRKQGGACLVASPRLEMQRIRSDVDIDEQVFELIAASIYLHKRYLFLLCVIYIPPNSSENDYMLLFRIIEQYCSRYNNVLVLGDFNLFSCPLSISNYYEYFISYCGFTQRNKIGNCQNRQLDLVLSSYTEDDIVIVRESGAPLVPIDAYHPPLTVDVRMRLRSSPRLSHALEVSQASTRTPRPTRWNFNKADYLLLYDMIANIDWTYLYELELEDSIGYFYDVLYSIIDKCVPRKKTNLLHSKYVYPEWYNIEIINEIKKKSHYHKQYKGSKSLADYNVFAESRKKVKSMVSLAYQNYRDRVQTHLFEDPKSFWKYTKSRFGTRRPNKILKNGKILTDEQCAEEFAGYFFSVYRTNKALLDVDKAVTDAGCHNGAARVALTELHLGEVTKALQQLKPKRSVGPDGIPPFIFRDCQSVMAEPLCYLFNQCLKTSTFPEVWKVTRVIPVPKGAESSNIEGYRPVAVLSTPAKVLESAIYKNVMRQVSGQLSEAQHGFRPNRSTTSNLLSHMANLLPIIDRGGQVDAAYFDFKKAFDLVDNDVLLSKLAGVGFTPHLLTFFASYMRSRKQFVEYAGFISEPYCTLSGVSQGSNLGPLEFLLMINDLPAVVQDARCLLFADDLKLSLTIETPDDCFKLQRDIDRVVTWSKNNSLQFNTSKCATITFSRLQNPIVHNYVVDGVPMVRVDKVRDLGVSIPSTLKFKEHITGICQKAYRNLGLILRMARGLTNINAVKVLYNALVRSKLESNSIIWAPHEVKYNLMLERVQNKFLRYLYLRYYGVYPLYPLMYPTLFVLGMVGYNELRARRALALTSYIFQIIRGRIQQPEVLGNIGFNVPDRYIWRRRQPCLLVIPKARTRLLKEAPLTRAFRILNLVAEKTDVFYCSLSEFTRICLHCICYKFLN